MMCGHFSLHWHRADRATDRVSESFYKADLIESFNSHRHEFLDLYKLMTKVAKEQLQKEENRQK